MRWALLLVSGLGQWEFLDMFQPQSDRPRRFKVIALGSLLLISFWTAQRAPYLCNPSGSLVILVFALFILFLLYLVSYGHIPDLTWHLSVDALSLLYVPLLLGHLIWLRQLPQGEWWVLWFLAVMFAGDTGAFYTGRALGKRKLYPQVSPGKTWAGLAGGLAACLAVGVLAGNWWLPEAKPFL